MPSVCCTPLLCRGCRSRQQLEELDAQRAAAQQELLEAREALSRAALEAEVARGEREALAEALSKVGPCDTPCDTLQCVPPLQRAAAMQWVHPQTAGADPQCIRLLPLCSGCHLSNAAGATLCSECNPRATGLFPL